MSGMAAVTAVVACAVILHDGTTADESLAESIGWQKDLF